MHLEGGTEEVAEDPSDRLPDKVRVSFVVFRQAPDAGTSAEFSLNLGP